MRVYRAESDIIFGVDKDGLRVGDRVNGEEVVEVFNDGYSNIAILKSPEKGYYYFVVDSVGTIMSSVAFFDTKEEAIADSIKK